LIQPDPDADYTKIDCLLREVEKAHLPLKLGFVGNEAYGNQQ
jgi:hypothetical protein